MKITQHIVNSANWDSGRAGNKVTGIVLHTMVGTVAGSQARFDNPNSQVSVHYGVGLDGSVVRWVDESNTAWQAGNYGVNLRTIGIEHEDNGNYNDSRRTAALYEASSSLVADICKRYGFPADKGHIFLHKDVIDKSVYPGGTACPDGLDTDKIIAMASAKLKGEEDMYFTAAEIKSIVRGYTGAYPGKGFNMDHFTKTPISQALIDELLNELAPYNEQRIKDMASLKAQSGDTSEANLLGQALITMLAKFGFKK